MLVGDNLLGSERPQDFVVKFERPYKPLLDAGVKFYASLGNHDAREQRFFALFNMGGQLYYAFNATPDVRFFRDQMYFNAISRTGQTVDSGAIPRRR